MLRIRGEHERPTEENLLGLGLPNGVAMPALVRVAGIPLEALQTGNELVQQSHGRVYDYTIRTPILPRPARSDNYTAYRTVTRIVRASSKRPVRVLQKYAVMS